MKKNVLLIIVFSVISYALGSYIEKESQLEVKRQALAAAAKYMDSVQKIDNNLKVVYKEVPYSKDIERPGTKINRNGYVPDAQAAVRMAVSIWSSLYGEYLPQENPPIKVSLKSDSLWIVWGTLLPNYEGGVPYIEIIKRNGTILKVSHGK